VLSDISGPKRGEVIEDRRKSHKHELCDFYTLANIITVKKLRMMRGVGHVANKGKNINVYRTLVGKTERYCLATQGTQGRIILKWPLKK
jgi:hypothetical protein